MKPAVRALLSALSLFAAVTHAADVPLPAVYTPTAEQRAALLQQVRAEDKARAEKKAKGPLLTIVDKGTAKAAIVAQGDDLRAAKLLQEWIGLMSGAELAIQDKPVAGTPSIFVGQAAVEAGCKVEDIQSRSREGIRIRCDGKNVYLASQSPAASTRAVGRFLEDEFGCRWFANPDWGRHYPQAQTLAVAVGEFAEKPGFLYRRIWGAEGAFNDNNWNIWNGHGGRDIPMAHSWGFLSKEDFEKHPEWFRLDENGKRVEGHWYNIGHPEVRKRFHEWAMKSADASPRGISFSPPDDHREDFSPESKAYDNPKIIDPSSGRVSMTDRFMLIVNEAANAIYKKYPDSICGFYAYSDYTLPPTRPELDKLAPNLSIWIAPIRFGRYHPLNHPNSPSQQLLYSIVKGWTDRAAMIGWRTYNYNLAEVMTPYSRLSIWAYDLPYLYKRGCVGISLESFDSWEIYAPHLYLSIRLSYDPDLDPWKIMADYWDKAYGPAAEAMEAYWMAVDEAFMNLKTESGSYHALHHVYTPERLVALEALMKKAEKDVAAGTDLQKHRVNLARRGLTRAGYWRKWFDLVNTGKVQEASELIQAWGEFVKESRGKKQANKYDGDYLNRFIANNVWSAWRALNPKDAKPNRVIAVLPDEWKAATGDDLPAGSKPWAVDFDDSGWKTIKTFSDTRNAQGLPEYFGAMWHRVRWTPPKSSSNLMLHVYKADRKVTLYVNGEQVGEAGREGFRGVTLDLEGKLKPGVENLIVLNIEHVPLPELFLGGLCGPVYLIEKAAP